VKLPLALRNETSLYQTQPVYDETKSSNTISDNCFISSIIEWTGRLLSRPRVKGTMQ